MGASIGHRDELVYWCRFFDAFGDGANQKHVKYLLDVNYILYLFIN